MAGTAGLVHLGIVTAAAVLSFMQFAAFQGAAGWALLGAMGLTALALTLIFSVFLSIPKSFAAFAPGKSDMIDARRAWRRWHSPACP